MIKRGGFRRGVIVAIDRGENVIDVHSDCVYAAIRAAFGPVQEELGEIDRLLNGVAIETPWFCGVGGVDWASARNYLDCRLETDGLDSNNNTANLAALRFNVCLGKGSDYSVF